MDCDGRKRLVFLADMHALLSFDRLVQSIRPAPARHQPAGEFINDNHFAILDDVVDIAFKNRVRFERLLHVVQRIDLTRIVEIMHAEQTLDFRYSTLRQRHRAAFLIDRVISLGVDGRAVLLRRIALDHRAPLQFRNDAVDIVILIGGLLRRPGNDQRGSRFIDEDIVNFVHHRIVELPLDIFLQRELHVVA